MWHSATLRAARPLTDSDQEFGSRVGSQGAISRDSWGDCLVRGFFQRDPNLRPPKRSAPRGASRVNSTVRLPPAVAGDADCVWSAADEAMLDKI